MIATGDFSPSAAAGVLGDAVVVEFRLVRDGAGQSGVGVDPLPGGRRVDGVGLEDVVPPA